MGGSPSTLLAGRHTGLSLLVNSEELMVNIAKPLSPSSALTGLVTCHYLFTVHSLVTQG
jgi:hypothetical protein